MANMQNTLIFQFTLGPVQGFVAQARRTRDFWAGSFILSWLSSVAIAAIQRQGGQVVFPVPDGAYLRHLYEPASAQDQDRPPQQGSIPNRFRATTAKVPTGFQSEFVTQAVQSAWKALAQAVWRHDLSDIASATTRTIWDRQVDSFWEISWVLSEASQAASLLDRRKNWRNTVPPQEPGHKCMMMDGWQELSGVTETALKVVDQFWSRLRQSGRPGIDTDLREGERLCAMAFIKRRFSRCFDEIEVELPGPAAPAAADAQPGQPGFIPVRVHGWRVRNAVPSVAFLAAAPWLAEVISRADPQVFEAFNQAACALTGYSEMAHVQDARSGREYEIDIRCVRDAAEQKSGFKHYWAGLDGQVYFPAALENPRIFGIDKQPQARAVLRQLQQLRKSAGQSDLPSPYYAILLMDGDQLGKHMGDEVKQQPISAALNAFTQSVGDIVREHNGFLIYAGGDDVLALLPLECALPAAAELQSMYRRQFEHYSPLGKPIDSTLSGAIEYVHIRTPLTCVLKDAHKLLDDIAKEQTGRNAIAVRVWKPSGLVAQWAMPWEKALDSQGQVRMAQLAQDFAKQARQADGEMFSNKFFFRMQQVLERFEHADNDILQKLLLAEYLHSWGELGKRTGLDMPRLEEQLGQLLAQCMQWRRPQPGQAKLELHKTPFNPEAALLVRFLAQKGLDKE